MSTSAEAFASAEPMVHITGLHKEFGPLHILKGIDLDVAPGEVCV
ncbi:ABC-transporter [Cutibacterium acnes JCM 18918]|nr:ABC-transporter [Cutibacterium acnes JCM 18918]